MEISTIFNVKKQDVDKKEVTDDTYESELTQAAQSAVETGVNEVGAPSKHGDDDFKAVKKATAEKTAAKKKAAKKKRKSARAARKRK